MPDSLDFDFTQLLNLAVDIEDAGAEVVPNVRKAVQVTARLAKDTMRELAAAENPNHAPLFARSIDYDTKITSAGAVTAEIGPDIRKKQGNLGLLDTGGQGVRSKPQRSAERTARAVEGDFITGILRATEGAL